MCRATLANKKLEAQASNCWQCENDVGRGRIPPAPHPVIRGRTAIRSRSIISSRWTWVIHHGTVAECRFWEIFNVVKPQKIVKIIKKPIRRQSHHDSQRTANWYWQSTEQSTRTITHIHSALKMSPMEFARQSRNATISLYKTGVWWMWSSAESCG